MDSEVKKSVNCSAKLIVIFIVETLHSRFLDRAIHPLDLSIRPWMVGLYQPMLNAMRLTDHVEAHGRE